MMSFFFQLFETDTPPPTIVVLYYTSYWPFYFIIIWRMFIMSRCVLWKFGTEGARVLPISFSFGNCSNYDDSCWRQLCHRNSLLYKIVQRVILPEWLVMLRPSKDIFMWIVFDFKWVQNQNIQSWHYCDALIGEVYFETLIILLHEFHTFSYFKQSLHLCNYCPL